MKKTIDTRQYVKNYLQSEGGEVIENIYYLMQYFYGNDEIICETIIVDRTGLEGNKERVTYGYFIVDEKLQIIEKLGTLLEESIFTSENPIHEFEY